LSNQVPEGFETFIRQSHGGAKDGRTGAYVLEQLEVRSWSSGDDDDDDDDEEEEEDDDPGQGKLENDRDDGDGGIGRRRRRMTMMKLMMAPLAGQAGGL
jgi:hypothetical protein